MTDLETPKKEPEPKREPEPKKEPPPTDFLGRFSKAWQWLIGALAAAGAFAVLNLGLGKLGQGPTTKAGFWTDVWSPGWALLGVLLFVAGVIIVTSTLIWFVNASSVTWAYLIKSTGRVQRKLRGTIEGAADYLGGYPTLSKFDAAYRAEIAKGSTKRAASFRTRIRAILDLAAVERTRIISPAAVATALAGVLVIGVGTWLFLLSVNAGEVRRADQLQAAKEAREDELRTFPTGTLLPRTPSEITLLIPAGTPLKEAQSWIDALGEPCLIPTTSPEAGKEAYKGIAAAVVDIGTPSDSQPVGGSPPTQAVYQIVTLRTNDCPNVVVGWIPPSWAVTGISAPASTSTPATSPSPGK